MCVMLSHAMPRWAMPARSVTHGASFYPVVLFHAALRRHAFLLRHAFMRRHAVMPRHDVPALHAESCRHALPRCVPCYLIP